MAIAGIAMLAGVLAVLALPVLPSGHLWLAAPLLVAAPFAWWQPTRFMWFAAAGFVWCGFCAQQQLTHRLAPALEGGTLALDGWVASIPQVHPEYTSFEFAVETLAGKPPGAGVPRRVRLTWTDAVLMPQPGEHWHLAVRLKQPRGSRSPGAFDYEGWLFRHAIGATGYALVGQSQRIAGGARFPLLQARSEIMRRIQRALPENRYAGISVALAVGDRGGIGREQWDVFRKTGTAHLVAISGLHIGLAAGLVFWLVGLAWRRSAWLCARVPVPIVGAALALLAAGGYAALAGFSVPTLRALIQLAAIAGATLLRRHARVWDMLGLALLGVLLLDPLSAGEPGFWLSFGAVAVIFYVFSGRVHLGRGRVMQLLRTQWAVGIGLLPMLVWFFQRATLVSPLANIVAVPLYSLLVVPLVLVGVVFLGVWPWLGALLLKAGTALIGLAWPLLSRLAELPAASLPTPAPSWWALGVAVLGAFWLMVPRAVPARWLGLVLWLPLFFVRPLAIPPGGFNFALLDVGQGLSTVVRTASHTLIYDTGPGFSESDTGQRVVMPWLQSRGLGAPDLIIVSHGDNDHAGGLRSLHERWPQVLVLSGEPERVIGTQRCARGQHWEWDGVSFEILAPDLDGDVTGNNASCVLQINGAGGNLLLVGDLMRAGEQRLLALDAARLGSDVLVVPHHGSLSSSSREFIEAVAPRYALFPVGYRNRWSFPKAATVDAYRNSGARLLDTVTSGTVEMRIWPDHEPTVISRWRQDHARFWTAR
ncbi:MAG: DNA internalization-related competence protein ComEC/Rec2 [Gammaproteobacteria bacterium]